MRISEIFDLGRSQRELDFVDIDINADRHLFLDPYFLGARDDAWSVAASRTVRSFFQHFLGLVREGQEAKARALFEKLHEPNETCLGLSRGAPSGRGIGRTQAKQIFESLLRSEAVRTGVLEHLEDTRLFVRGVDKDKVSDMTTNIIRDHLVRYTQAQCELWGIPISGGVASGWYWDRNKRMWDGRHTDMLVIEERRILLVPKGVVSFVDRYTPDQYRQHYALNYLQNEHLRLNSSLVRTRKSKKLKGERYVTKKSIVENSPKMDKDWLADFTASHPDVFRDFREHVGQKSASLSDDDLGATAIDDVIDRLIEELRKIQPGGKDATRYHRTAAAALELIFYPNLFDPEVEQEINQGRKRIDVVFENAAVSGFFRSISEQHDVPAGFVFFEMKNYSPDIANPELDQVIGRFHVNRGRLGFVVCRTINDMELFIQRCADSYQAGHGTVIPIVDDDIVRILEALKGGEERPEEGLLRARFRKIAML